MKAGTQFEKGKATPVTLQPFGSYTTLPFLPNPDTHSRVQNSRTHAYLCEQPPAAISFILFAAEACIIFKKSSRKN